MNTKRAAFAFAALLPSLCFLACGNDPTPPTGTPCTYNSDCTAPLLCLGGQCKPECIESIDCAMGMSCVEGVCQGGTGGQGGAGGMSSSSSNSSSSGMSSSGMGGSMMSSSSSGMGGMGGMAMSSSSSSSSGGGSCNNNTMDGTETDVDCGGAACAPCTDGKKCTKNQDCTGGTCMGNVCSSQYDLSIIRTGSGQGSVTSMPAGINCGAQCTSTYTSGTQITLTAAPAGDSTFAGWSGGGCSGNGTCMLTMDAAKSISAKFDLKPTGMAAWQKSYGDTFNPAVFYDVSFDDNGNELLTGAFTNTVNFGGGPISAVDTDIIVSKLDPTGAHVWSRRIGTTGTETGYSIYALSNGDVMVGGTLSNNKSTDMGGGATLTCTVGFIAKYSAATGAHIWSKCLGTGAIDFRKMANDSMGNPVVMGWISGTVDFGGGPIVADAQGSIFLAKFSGADGSHIWSKKIAPEIGNLYDLAVDSAGNVGMIGSYSTSINVGGAPLPSNGALDMWVARYNAGGQHVWSKHFGDTGDDEAMGIDFDATGNLVVAGTYTGAIDFGNGTLTNGGAKDAFLVKLTGANGSLLWASHFGATSTETSKTVSVAPDGTIVVGGIFYNTTNFGSGTISGQGGSDLFVVKYDALGTLLWAKPLGSGGNDDMLAIDTDMNNNSAFAGLLGYYTATVQKFLP